MMYYSHCASTIGHYCIISDMQRMIWGEPDLTGIVAEWEMSIKYVVSICCKHKLEQI